MGLLNPDSGKQGDDLCDTIRFALRLTGRSSRNDLCQTICFAAGGQGVTLWDVLSHESRVLKREWPCETESGKF